MTLNRRWAIAAFLLGVLCSANASALEWDVFRVCADPNSLPLSNKNQEGYENRIADILAADLGVPVEYTWFPQRRGFIRHTLREPAPDRDGYKCDVVMGVPDGFELVITTEPYYRSTYAMVFRKDQEGLQNVETAKDFLALDDSVKKGLRIGIFDQTPAAAWLSRYGLIKQMVPFPTMSGDPAEYPGQIIERELVNGNIDVAMLWGPIAGYFVHRLEGRVPLKMVPMRSESGIRFDFAISMGVRFGDGERKRALEELLARNSDKIEAVLKEYYVPLVSADGSIL